MANALLERTEGAKNEQGEADARAALARVLQLAGIRCTDASKTEE